MVMRSPSKEKALTNLTSKSMWDNDQPVNSPFGWMHRWSNQSKFDYFSYVSCGRLCHGCLRKRGNVTKRVICYFSDFLHKILPYRKSSPSEYFRSKETGTFRVTKVGPLPSPVDIVAPILKYGFKCFMKYPADIPDYFKQAFPEGLTYDRKLTFQDGGCATASVRMRWVILYYLPFNHLFNLQIAQRSLIHKGTFLIKSITCEGPKNKNRINFLAYSATLHKDSRRISMMKDIMEASKLA